jgi:hypothetical protein
VQRAGIIMENQSYEFLDHPRRDAELQLYHYYRLKQVDNDGKYEYSNIVMIEFDAVNIPNINIFPNPTTDFINIEISENQIGETAQIIDIQGRFIKGFQLQIRNNQYLLTSLVAGTYFVRVGVEVQKNH